jgi:negative regulator of flagellin synthesis FlgM
MQDVGAALRLPLSHHDGCVEMLMQPFHQGNSRLIVCAPCPDLPAEPTLMHSRNFRYDPPEWTVDSPAGTPSAMTQPREDSPMDVSSTGSVGGAGPVRPAQIAPSQGPGQPAPGGLEAPQDEVEISSAARILEQLQSDPEVRAARLAEIRAAIEAGVYETDDKLSAAVDRLLDEIQRAGG